MLISFRFSLTSVNFSSPSPSSFALSESSRFPFALSFSVVSTFSVPHLDSVHQHRRRKLDKNSNLPIHILQLISELAPDPVNVIRFTTMDRQNTTASDRGLALPPLYFPFLVRHYYPVLVKIGPL